MLEQAVNDYLLWMISEGYSRSTLDSYEKALNNFILFVNRRGIVREDIFTLDTLRSYQKARGHDYESPAIRGLSRFLYQQKRIKQPIPRKQTQRLPVIYEEYLEYRAKARQDSGTQIKQIRRVLAPFRDYLERLNIKLSRIQIEQIDAFFVEFNSGFSQKTSKIYRTYLRGFLKYLYQVRKILKRDLASLVVGPHTFSRAKPPMFLRPHEMQSLFAGLEFSTAGDLRTYAMIHLAYTLGLRPKEICLITLDDISFKKGELSLRERKAANPIKLPLPKATTKAMAAYLIGARPKSKLRQLFLSLQVPYRPVKPYAVSHAIKRSMHKVGFPPEASAYWLRHTYAQNLLESGVSLYEIKEMLGHDSIESTRKYLHIHISLMRRVLFDETL
jgi:site-specific recombinase XerD